MLIAGVAGCTSIDAVIIFKKKRKNLKDISVKAKAIKDTDGKISWYESITLHFTLVTDDITEEEAHKVIGMSLGEYCSVSKTMERSGCKIDYTLEIKRS